MNFLTSVISSIIKERRRIVKIIKLGKADVQEVYEVSPFGLDSNPIADMVAVYSETLDDSDPVIVGYINPNQLAEPGEFRTYSTDSNGTVKTYTWLKKDGTIELGGNEHNLVRYIPLNNGLQVLVTFINQQLPLIAAGILTGGGSYTPGTASLDITDAKINEIKTL